MWNGIKAVDLLVVDPSLTGWLIEVKDYTQMSHNEDERPLPTALACVVANKVFDTLAAILPAKVRASDDVEKNVASAMARSQKLRVVLHLEQPNTRFRLRPHAINPADIKQQLKRLLKPVDAHPIVVAMAGMQSLGWKVVRPRKPRKRG
jgi:hypothetical protein